MLGLLAPLVGVGVAAKLLVSLNELVQALVVHFVVHRFIESSRNLRLILWSIKVFTDLKLL